MAKVTAEQITALANTLATVGAIFNPAAGATIKGLVTAGTELNNMIRNIREQTEESAAEVWEEVRADYEKSLEGFQASVERNRA